MLNRLVLLVTVVMGIFFATHGFSGSKKGNSLVSELTPIYDLSFSLDVVIPTLQKEAPTLNQAVIDKVYQSLKCSDKKNIPHTNILTVIDYSLPSNEKRLWVFDLHAKKLLFNTYVSHGIKSGQLQTTAFSNKYDSKASSMGVFATEKPYYGRQGLSLRLNGLDRGFNDNAANRYIVMHGGWYMDENFIKKYGRPGRSWGCPAVPLDIVRSIVNTLKENSLYVSYYPSDAWFTTSRFLNCEKPAQSGPKVAVLPSVLPPINNNQEFILFVDQKNKNRRDESAPIIAMPADRYEQIFQTTPPVGRMLRRQINNMEYIALSSAEFNRIIANNSALNAIYFVRPDVKMVRGYYLTLMKIVPLGKIKSIMTLSENKRGYAVNFENNSSVNIKLTDQFIRWVGL
jgi:hypothetical protein